LPDRGCSAPGEGVDAQLGLDEVSEQTDIGGA
jgi:hypothetical protein